MKTITYQELKKKDVVNIDTGKNLGKVIDLVLNEKSLQVLKLVVPGKKNGFLACETFEIDACEVKKIGDDAILVGFEKPCDSPCRSPRQEGFESNGVEKAVFGHIHGAAYFPLKTWRGKVEYVLTSCDKVGFRLVKIY